MRRCEGGHGRETNSSCVGAAGGVFVYVLTAGGGVVLWWQMVAHLAQINSWISLQSDLACGAGSKNSLS